jgi:hypothetical protein
MPVLVVEDDAGLAETLALGLRRESGLPGVGDRA